MNDSTLTARRKVLILAGVLLIAVTAVIYALSRAGIGIPCLFYRLTGLQCPGCGNTRAALALLRLDWRAMLNYNLLFPVELFYLSWVGFHVCRRYWKTGHLSYHPPFLLLDILILLSVVLWGILRNL